MVTISNVSAVTGLPFLSSSATGLQDVKSELWTNENLKYWLLQKNNEKLRKNIIKKKIIKKT